MIEVPEASIWLVHFAALFFPPARLYGRTCAPGGPHEIIVEVLR